MIPYIDCYVGILRQWGGVVWVPGRTCLLQVKEKKRRLAAEELENREIHEFRQVHGNVAGVTVPDPARVRSTEHTYQRNLF